MKKGTSPRSRLRELLREIYLIRGDQWAGLWLFYSSKLNRPIGVSGDLEYLNAMWLEADPKFASYQLQPEPQIVQVGSDNHKTQFDAVAQVRGGGTEAIEVKEAAEEANPQDIRTLHQRDAQIIAAGSIGAKRRVVTDDHLLANQQLIFNWIRANSWIAAARGHPSSEFEEHAGLRLHGRESTLGELQREIVAEDWPLFLPALLRLYQNGVINSDLAVKPLCRGSRFWTTPK